MFSGMAKKVEMAVFEQIGSGHSASGREDTTEGAGQFWEIERAGLGITRNLLSLELS